MLEFNDVSKGEKSRTYLFSDGKTLRVENVARLCVRPSGGHRLETADGRKIIVNAGWLAIEIEADAWSF